MKDHPAVAAYNVVNEPAPELGAGVAEDADTPDLKAWYARIRGTPRDLPAFYDEVVAAIRAVDPTTPIMLDGGWYASAHGGLTYWPKKNRDSRILYAFHMYEPYAWSNPRNHRAKAPLVYPGPVDGAQWDRARVAAWIAPTYDWASAQGVPMSRLVAAELGCHRRSPGAARYLEDVLSTVEARGSHWAFYSFREDGYDGYDYEVGDGPLPPGYWEAKERGEPFTLERGPNPLWDPIGRRLESSRPPEAGR